MNITVASLRGLPGLCESGLRDLERLIGSKSVSARAAISAYVDVYPYRTADVARATMALCIVNKRDTKWIWEIAQMALNAAGHASALEPENWRQVCVDAAARARVAEYVDASADTYAAKAVLAAADAADAAAYASRAVVSADYVDATESAADAADIAAIDSAVAVVAAGAAVAYANDDASEFLAQIIDICERALDD